MERPLFSSGRRLCAINVREIDRFRHVWAGPSHVCRLVNPALRSSVSTTMCGARSLLNLYCLGEATTRASAARWTTSGSRTTAVPFARSEVAWVVKFRDVAS
jgi:hypothetical protein